MWMDQDEQRKDLRIAFYEKAREMLLKLGNQTEKVKLYYSDALSEIKIRDGNIVVVFNLDHNWREEK